jgi:hypothetical protein
MIPAVRDRMQPVSRNCLLHAFVAVLSLALGGAATAQSDPALTIAESGDNYRLSVPVSRLVMTIPKGAFTVANVSAGGATARTWIDVHISVTTKDPSSVARATALNVLKVITVAVPR